jgi:cytochrome c553
LIDYGRRSSSGGISSFMKRHALAILVASLLPLDPAAAADAPAGGEMAAACVACHGENGNSKTENIPSLAGHPAPYLTIQLILFREQQRRNEVMTPLAKALTDEDIEGLAAYFAGQKRIAVTQTSDPTMAAQGKETADAHRCGVCHLPDYSGREQIPRLSAQREDYLAKTMRDYKAGSRSGLDGMMTSVLHPVTDEQIALLAAYLAQLP